MTFRKLIFWMHLIAGTFAGIVVLIMSVTGVLLTYERQMIAWSDRGYRSFQPSPAATRLPVEALLERVRSEAAALPSTLVLHSDPAAPAEAAFGRERTVYLDVYSGHILGEGAQGIRSFFRVVTDWHRWLGQQGPGRATGRAITGACNLAFLFLVASGFYLWFPRKWSWQHFRPVMLFRGGLSGKARDFNWHNVIGFWSAIPLFLIVLGGVVISYPWATALVYSITGSEPPAASRGPRPPAGREPDNEASEVQVAGFEQAWRTAEQRVPGWRTITLRVPSSSRAPLAFTIDEAHRGRPDKRTQLTVRAGSGEIVRSETFADYNTGRRVRTWLRWIHTGEAAGILGQTIAGIVSAGAVVLVWTGIALSLRRFRSWRARRGVQRETEAVGVK